MNGAARLINEASPTPTSLQKPKTKNKKRKEKSTTVIEKHINSCVKDPLLLKYTKT